ncbi:MAG: flagellar hook-basal body complex protein FliE [Alphaproteobacteria bacterium]|nr:flagellar hook-basal body complex protein FliE [Alphaproteobacteria bacterium]
MTSPLHAAQAYRATGGLPRADAAEAPAASGLAAGAAGDFAHALRQAAAGAVSAGREAEALSTQALAGQGDLTAVVAAVARAELALQTAVAVRDRVVAAYQDVMRMPI